MTKNHWVDGVTCCDQNTQACDKNQVCCMTKIRNLEREVEELLDSLAERKKIKPRPDWDEYYLGIANAVSKRGECKRRQVGAVIVKNRSIVGTGYNGTSPGAKSCLDGACPRADSNVEPNANYAESGCHVIHAETNALMRTHWNDMTGATLYVTDRPCLDCWPKIRNTGILKVVWPGGEETIKYLKPIKTEYVSFNRPIPVPEFPENPITGDVFHLKKERLSWYFDGENWTGPTSWDQ